MAEAGRRDEGFSAKNRTLAVEDEVVLTSAGIDIGSATSHLVLSRIVMERRDNRYVVKSRALLFESAMQLTPYVDRADIDAQALRTFFDAQLGRAGLRPADVDVGALILTGVAARRRNARAIGDALALETGRFVALSAGDRLETTLIAHGSGAAKLSRESGLRVMAVDVGGGTSKIAVCEHGAIVGRSVTDVGARLLCFDDGGRVSAVETAGRLLAEETGIRCEIGAVLSAEERTALAEHLAIRLLEAIGAEPETDGLTRWLRTGPLEVRARPDVLLFSGGVAEYIYGREHRAFGDLGPALATAIARRVTSWGIDVREPAHAIRATVLGASQYTLQLSGSTIFVSPQSALPVRNVVVARPSVALDGDIASSKLSAAIRAELGQLDLHDPTQHVALCFDWAGSATYPRLDAFCRGVVEGLAPVLDRGQPLMIVTNTDIGGLIGIHFRHECGVTNPVISIDGIALQELDFIDIGALIDCSGAVPVIVKSLLFPSSAGTAAV